MLVDSDVLKEPRTGSFLLSGPRRIRSGQESRGDERRIVQYTVSAMAVTSAPVSTLMCIPIPLTKIYLVQETSEPIAPRNDSSWTAFMEGFLRAVDQQTVAKWPVFEH